MEFTGNTNFKYQQKTYTKKFLHAAHIDCNGRYSSKTAGCTTGYSGKTIPSQHSEIPRWAFCVFL